MSAISCPARQGEVFRQKPEDMSQGTRNPGLIPETGIQVINLEGD